MSVIRADLCVSAASIDRNRWPPPFSSPSPAAAAAAASEHGPGRTGDGGDDLSVGPRGDGGIFFLWLSSNYKPGPGWFFWAGISLPCNFHRTACSEIEPVSQDGRFVVCVPFNH